MPPNIWSALMWLFELRISTNYLQNMTLKIPFQGSKGYWKFNTWFDVASYWRLANCIVAYFWGVYRGGKWTQLASKWGSGEENYTLKGGRINSVFVHKKWNSGYLSLWNKNAPECTKSYSNFHFPGVTPWRGGGRIYLVFVYKNWNTG